MSLHKNPKYQIPSLIEALKDHGLEHDEPSQLSDAFRTGWTAALVHTGQAVDKDSLTAEAAPAGEVASEPEKFWCETCEGGGMIIHQVRGECSCPDCDGKGYWTRATPAAAPGYVSAPSPVEDKDGAAHWKARYEARELEAHQLSEKLIQLRRVGEVLSNCAFNLSLRDPGQFTTRDIEVLASAFKAWDAALSKIWSNGVDRALAQEVGAKG